MLIVRTFSRPATLIRSRRPSSPQHVTPPSRRTAHVRPRAAAMSVSPLRGPSSIENEPNAGAGAVTVSGELESQRPTSAPGGKSRRDGSNRSPHSPSGARCCNPNSTRPLSKRRATMRTSVSSAAPPATVTVSGELESQRPTSAPGGKSRRDGSNRSLHSSSAARCCNPNSTRPLSKRRATMRTAPSDSCPVAVLGIAPTLATTSSTITIVRAANAISVFSHDQSDPHPTLDWTPAAVESARPG